MRACLKEWYRVGKSSESASTMMKMVSVKIQLAILLMIIGKLAQKRSDRNQVHNVWS